MGEIAEMMIDGILCEQCGEYIGGAVGYPRTCSGCDGSYNNEPAEWKINEGKKIEALQGKGYQVKKFNDFHFRINNKIDVWPSTGRYWLINTKIKGKFFNIDSLEKIIQTKL